MKDSQRRFNPDTVGAELFFLQQAGNSVEFIAHCQAIKRGAIELIQQDNPGAAAKLLEKYGQFFKGYKHENNDFTLAILPLFPANKTETMILLGKSKKIDECIINYKLDRTTHSKATGDDIKHVIEWAVERGDLRLVEGIISHVTTDLLTNHADNKSVHIHTFSEILSALLWADKLQEPLSPAVDDAIASIVRQRAHFSLSQAYLVRMARAGLSKTLMKTLEFGRVSRHEVLSPENVEDIASVLPKIPTPEQAHWITSALTIPGLPALILFDPAFDLDAYIEALNTTCTKLARPNDLTFKNLEIFSDLLTDKSLDTPFKKRRAIKLLDAAAQSEFESPGSPRTSKHVREALGKTRIPATVLRMMSMFKVQSLEDDIGL